MTHQIATHFTHQLYSDGYASLVGGFIAEQGLTHHFYLTVNDVDRLPDRLTRGTSRISFRSDGHTADFREFQNGWIDLTHYRNALGFEVNVRGYFPTAEAAASAFAMLRDILPVRAREIDVVPVHFWNWTDQHGPQQTIRHISAPLWDSINDNYRSGVAVTLRKTMQFDGTANQNGRVLLWRGDPGTGKTWALRALLREWKGWCVPHYIVDPDVFFSRAEYLIRVMTQVCVNDGAPASQPGSRYGSHLVSVGQPNWNLLILEDTGELIAADAKQRTGQALSKLLNLGDGLLGQGLNLLTLITTNEDHKDLHPAITRQGRCLSDISFGQFEPDEGHRWLQAKGLKESVEQKRRTLADLYALLPEEAAAVRNTVERVPAGFVNGSA